MNGLGHNQEQGAGERKKDQLSTRLQADESRYLSIRHMCEVANIANALEFIFSALQPGRESPA